jgi:hypothetical protein
VGCSSVWRGAEGRHVLSDVCGFGERVEAGWIRSAEDATQARDEQR